MDWLNYHHLQYFWHVAREGSIQRASELLHVTPATVSIQLRKLEKSLGVKLVRKQGRGLALTEMGQSVRDYADDIFATGRELLEMVHGRPTGRPMRLRVGITDVMPKLVAHRLLEPAYALDDGVRVECEEGDVRRLAADLAIHQLDVVLSDTPLDPLFEGRAYSHLLGESPVVVMAVPALAAELRDGFPGSLDGAPFLLPTQNSVIRRMLDVYFDEQHLHPHVRGEFADSAMLKVTGHSGLGAFAVPEVIAEDVGQMYSVEPVGVVEGVVERFFALSVERKIAHPAVVALGEAAHDWLK